jgi:lysylphosphatidylglycerol synthetase-like protein (DUF2156 family)
VQPLTATLSTSPQWPLLATAALVVVVFAASGAVLVATVRRPAQRRLAGARAAVAAVSAALVAVSIVGPFERWELALACLSLLISVQALALAFGQAAPLETYVKPHEPEQDPAWWPEFERRFWNHVRRAPHEEDPMRRAVTRSKRPPPRG